MIQTQFRNLPLILVRFAPQTTHSGDYGSCRKISDKLHILDEAILVLNETEKMHDELLAANKDWLPEEEKGPFGLRNHAVGGLPPSSVPRDAYGKLQIFKAREVGLISSYLLSSATLEGVVEKVFKELLDYAEKIAPAEIGPLKSRAEQETESRKNEFFKSQLFRNKVFAHTAYGSPQKGDSLSMQLTSIQHLVGQTFTVDQRGITLGESTTVVQGGIPVTFYAASVVFPYPHKKDNREKQVSFEPINIPSLGQGTAARLGAWFKMFETVFAHLLQLDNAAFLAANWGGYKAIEVERFQGKSAFNFNSL
jgi:hypothetical protein